MFLPNRPFSSLALATVVILIAGGISFSAAAAQADTSDPATPVDVQSAPDEATASTLAASEGHAVRVDSETTETTAVSAQPDGTMQFEADTLPVRTLRSGSWTPVDENLSAGSSGMLEPRTPAVPVRFTAGGSNVLDQVQTDNGDWITETWPFGTLPAPTVSGDTATYADALPGVDLQLTATPTGMSSLLVVKTPAAAADSRLASFKLGVHGATLSAAPADSMVAKTSDGATLTAGSPLWWDSAQGGNADGPGGNEPNRPVEHTDDSTGMTLDVASTVAAANPTYPVFVDPDWNSGITSSWYTDKAYPSQSYLTAAESDVLRVGIYAQYESHMFFQFPITSKIDTSTIITDASLDMTQQSLDACPTNSITLELYGPQTAGFTWNGESGVWHGSLGSKTPGTCSNPSADVAVGWDVKSAIESMRGKSSVQFGLKSTTSAQSRRHFSRAAKLTIGYDNLPDDPATPKFTSPIRGCATTSSAPAYINTNQPLTFQVYQDDPDGGNVGVDFTVNQATTGTLWTTGSVTNQARGNISWTYTGPAFTNGYLYAWKAQGDDGQYKSTHASPWCYFRVDNTAPPAVSFDGPSHDQPLPAATAVGVPMTVNLNLAAGIAGYEYWILRDPSTSTPQKPPVAISTKTALPTCGTKQGQATIGCPTDTSISIAPIDTSSVLWVAQYDNAGNVSTAAALPLLDAGGGSIAPPTTTTDDHRWKVSTQSTPLPDAIPDTGATGGQDLTLGSGLARGTQSDIRTTLSVPVLSFSGTVSAPTTLATTTGRAIDTTKSFTVSAWVNPATSTGTQTIVAESGTTRSGFVLESVSGTMKFCMQPQVGTATDCVSAAASSSPGTWVMVTGIWDAVNQQIRIVLDGASTTDVVAPHIPPTNDVPAAGPLTVGSAQVAGAAAAPFNGLIADPRITQRVLDGNKTIHDLSQVFG